MQQKISETFLVLLDVMNNLLSTSEFNFGVYTHVLQVKQPSLAKKKKKKKS